MARLRIGINALYLIPGGVGGTEIYLRNLLAALAEIDTRNEYIVFTNRETDAALVPARPGFRQAPQPFRAAFRPGRMVWEQIGLPARGIAERLDVLFNPGFTAPILSHCPNVTVFHDLQHKRHPEYFRWFDLPFWKMFLYLSAHRSKLLVAVSEATRADLLRYYRLPERKVRLAPHGVEAAFFEVGRARRPDAALANLLCVSTLHPHKNLERLIRAFAGLHRRRPGLRLVIAGLRGFHAGTLENLIAALELTEAVRLTGWIPREELMGLFREACAFVYPSTFEGFGMPLLEALAAGIPTACSRIEPLASLAGKAALQFDPADEDAIADALERLVCDAVLRERLAAEGPARAAQFSWRRTAELTLDVLREAAGPAC